MLFRGEPDDQSEGSIRQKLIENNHIEAIIGLPADIFFGTGIPTIVMVLRKDRKDNGVLIIDTSKGFKKEGKKNKLRSSDIRRIVDTYVERGDVPKFSKVVSKEEIRQNNYNLNIPRYVNSSEDPETWDLHSIMFGGIPKSELGVFQSFFDALPGLKEDLFTETDTPFVKVKVTDIQESIQIHPSVSAFIASCEHLNIAEEEETITRHIFGSLEQVPLIDRYEAYQFFADKWTTIAQDLEIIQSEGFEATRMVDPNMVVKKKDDKEYEIQDGWVGRILPFDLVQTTHLKDEWTALRSMEKRLEEASNEIDSTFDELDEEERTEVSNDDGTMNIKEVERRLVELLADVETEEINILEEYLLCTRKKEKQDFIAAHPEINWQSMEPAKDGTYSAKTIKEQIARIRESYPFAEDSTEAKLIKITALTAEVKRLKADIKTVSAALHEHTKEKIEEGLTDDEIRELLSLKWIQTLFEHLIQLPHTVVGGFIQQLCCLVRKYDTTLVDVERDIREASESLVGMIDELTGSDYDLAALAEFKQLLLHA